MLAPLAVRARHFEARSILIPPLESVFQQPTRSLLILAANISITIAPATASMRKISTTDSNSDHSSTSRFMFALTIQIFGSQARTRYCPRLTATVRIHLCAELRSDRLFSTRILKV